MTMTTFSLLSLIMFYSDAETSKQWLQVNASQDGAVSSVFLKFLVDAYSSYQRGQEALEAKQSAN